MAGTAKSVSFTGRRILIALTLPLAVALVSADSNRRHSPEDRQGHAHGHEGWHWHAKEHGKGHGHWHWHGHGKRRGHGHGHGNQPPTATNNAPTAASAVIATNEDAQSAAATPLVTDPNAGDTHTFAIVTQGVSGSAAVINNGLVYTPNPNFNGADSFTFRATDSGGLSVVGTATVTVNPANDAPTVANLSISTDEDTQSAPVTPNVADVDSGDTYAVSTDTQPAHGTASVSSNQLTYVSNANYNGPDSFTFRVTDSGGLSATAMATVTVGPVNDAPTSANAAILTDEDTQSAGITPNVSDPDVGDSFTFAIVSQPENGSAQAIANALVYTPVANYSGADSFTFRATDTAGLSVTGTAAVTVVPVNDAPTATGGGRPVSAGLSGSRAPWVDDIDILDTATFQILTQPPNGSASFVGNQWTYTPIPRFTSGTDSFTYQATDSGGATITGTARIRIFDSNALAICRRISTVTPTGTLNLRTRSNPCAFYAVRTTRMENGIPITMDYLLNWPATPVVPVGVVVLVGGGNLDMTIVGTALTGVADNSGGNFVVRTAQLLADAGFITVAIDRPSDQPPPGSTDSIADADQYRISAKHAVDIVSVLKHVNTSNLPVFLVGTSHGALSAVANNLIATGISVSSSVTSASGGFPARLYLGRMGFPSLQPSFVQRPTHVLWHQNDLCSVSTPANSQALYDNLTTAGVTAAFSIASGGVRVTAPATEEDVCGALDHHGYLGIEPTAVGYIADWLHGRVSALAGDKPPEAAFVTVLTGAGVSKHIDLATLARDADGDTLSYALSHATTSLGGTVSLTGTIVTYTPPAGVTNQTDSFVYVVTDGRGGVAAAVISIQIGS